MRPGPASATIPRSVEPLGAALFDRKTSIPLPPSTLDEVLTLQLLVAWAGEGGEEPRLGWWRTDLTSEFGGQDLFARLLPATAPWAALQAAREAARRHDAAARSRDHDPDRLLTLYRLGFELDEKVEERFQHHKRGGRAPADALPGLRGFVDSEWNRARLADQLGALGPVDVVAAPAGRRLRLDTPALPDRLVRALAAGLLPLGAEYPLPHVRLPERDRREEARP